MSRTVKGAIFVLLAIVLVIPSFSILLGTLIPIGSPVTEAEGKMSDPDAFGYRYVDSKEPAPLAEFDWIDATGGTRTSLNGDDTYITVYLPFEFPFYGRTYTRCYPSSNGLLGIHQASSSLSNRNIPSTSSPNGYIAPWHNDIRCSRDRGSYLYTSEGTNEWGVDYFVLEWYNVMSYWTLSGSQYQITFEVILYEDGLIKIQYLDATSAHSSSTKGAGSTVGIESPDGRTGVKYSYNQAILEDNLAIIFGENTAELIDTEMDTEDGGEMYPHYRDYMVSFKVRHPFSNDLLRGVGVSFGGGLASINMLIGEEGGVMKYKVDDNDYIYFNKVRSTITPDEAEEYLEVKFYFTPNFNYPFLTSQSIAVAASGVGVMPATLSLEDAYSVKSEMELTGSLRAESDNLGFVENGGWMRAREVFRFTGFRPIYLGTTLSPRAGGVTVIATDEVGTVWEQIETGESGQIGDYDVLVQLDDFLVTKHFNLTIGYIPEMRDLSEFAPYVIRVDPFKPSPPVDVNIHADGFSDPTISFDNDTEVFVTWEPGQDMESGIYGHYLSQCEPGTDPDDIPIFIRYPISSTRFELSEPGFNRIYVWSADRAGMISDPTLAFTNIDTSPVTFSEFSPGHQIWMNTQTPVCSVLIDDGDGSGIASEYVEYSFTASSINEYSTWMRVPGIRDGASVRASITETFVGGKSNFIHFRAKDIAGNGWTESVDYNVWIDVDAPIYSTFRPISGDYQDSSNVIISLDIHDISGGYEGSGAVPESIEYRFSTGGKGLYGDWYLSPIHSYESGVFHIEMEMDFAEGTENYIQFRCMDVVGNTAMSPDFNIKVNSAPLVSSFISSPAGPSGYTSDEKIFFDASDTIDPDGDDLGFLWYSDLEGFLSGRSSFYRSLNPGLHVITLIVNDPSHSMVEYRDIMIFEVSQIDPSHIDSDGDGLYDAWELMYKLDRLAYDSQLDTDHDTFTNLQEFQNGTDPTQASSHPPYLSVIDPTVETDVNADSNDQYTVLTVTLALVSLIVVLVLIFLAFSKRHNFRMEIDEERELETDEQDYRKAIQSRRPRSLDIDDKGGI